jgi:hypothetical protein
MGTKQTCTTFVNFGGDDIEVELELTIAAAEPDVGIMSDYIDDWSVTAVAGDTDALRCGKMQEAIEAEYGSDRWYDKLHDEGAAEIDYDDYPYYEEDYPEYDR